MGRMGKAIRRTDFQLPGQTAVYHGKVRDVYTIKDTYMVSVATDRISAFDVILPEPIPYKGQVLNLTAEYFLKATADICPNWLLGVPDPNVALGYKCEPFKVEVVIRGALVGYSWRRYQTGARELCGAPMPDGLQEYDPFPEPLITPSTKADEGHDEDIAPAEIIKRGLATRDEWDRLETLARKLFARGQDMAAKRGLYLADTKYEFGKHDGQIYLIDEIHTPDSSRYFYTDSLEAYLQDRSQPLPRHLSKEFVREWLMENNFSGQAGQTVPEMTPELVGMISERYRELYEKVTGQTFSPPDESVEPLARIETNIKRALEQL